MRALNKAFKEDPIGFLNHLVLLTRPGQPCPTCNCVMDLGVGRWGGANVYARPDPMVITFDLIAGAYAGGIPAGSNFGAVLDGAVPQPPPAGLAYTNPLAKYATLQVMKVGHARVGRPKGMMTNAYTAYWLPWAHQAANELHLTDLNVKFFFTAMFSGCTFCVATPAGANGARAVWVTHIAWDPGLVNPWGGGPIAGTPNARRLIAENAFYAARGGLGSFVRSVSEPVAPPDNTLPAAAGRPPVVSVPIAAGPVPPINGRFAYGTAVGGQARAFIVGWRDGNNNWNFAVQKHPVGFNALGAPVAVPAPVAPAGVRQFY